MNKKQINKQDENGFDIKDFEGTLKAFRSLLDTIFNKYDEDKTKIKVKMRVDIYEQAD